MAVLTGISKVVIGFTVLAWGTAIADFVADTTLARKGLGIMAVPHV